MSRKINLKGRVLVITGASSGIGQATAIAAAKAGMNLVLAARRRDRLDNTAKRIETMGGKALAITIDVANPQDIKRMVEECCSHFGRLDAMLANAGYGYHHPLESMTREEHEKMFTVNYWGTIECWQAALPIMRKQGHGHLLLTTSVLAKAGLPYYGPYCATKAAQAAIASSMRHEVKADNIEVTSIFPVLTQTEFHQVSSKLSGRNSNRRIPAPWFLRQSAEKVAKKIIASLHHPIPEVWPSHPARVLTALTTLSPRLASKILSHLTR